MGHGVPVVHRLVGPEVHHHRLRADRQRAGEVLVVDRGLEVHQHLAGLVVRAVQVAAVVDPGDAAPAAAVERLHVQRVAELLGEVVEVERLVVLLRRVGPAHVVDGVLVGHQRGRRDLEPEPDHRAVGAVLLHRLERERAVEQVGPVDQRGLLQPLARVVVPVRQPVDHQLGADRVVEVERLDGEPLAGHGVVVAVVLDRADPTQDRLERAWPVLLGSEQQSDQVVPHACSPLPGRRLRCECACCPCPCSRYPPHVRRPPRRSTARGCRRRPGGPARRCRSPGAGRSPAGSGWRRCGSSRGRHRPPTGAGSRRRSRAPSRSPR